MHIPRLYNRLLKVPVLLLCLGVMPYAFAEEPDTRLGFDELYDLVYDQTADCRKEKDKSSCVNYFSPEGELTQLRDSGKRLEGRWFLDDSDRLCILWNGKHKPLCFVVTVNKDGTYNMSKGGKHKSTILGVTSGNRDGL